MKTDMLSLDELKSCIHNEWLGMELCYFAETGSTNSDAARLATEGAGHGTVVVADRQSAGRGRRGRAWQSPAGKDLYFSMILKPDFEPDKAAGLTLVMALAVTYAIETFCGIRAGIKWPNDVVVNGKKVCGILTEMSMEADAIRHIVIGTGINVNRTDGIDDMPEEIRNVATSLYLESGNMITRAGLLQEVLHSFEFYYAQYLQSLSMELLMEAYNSRLVNCGNKVRVLDPKGEWEGIAKGINKSGELLVETENGKIVEVYAGEVSVRGIYGYV